VFRRFVAFVVGTPILLFCDTERTSGCFRFRSRGINIRDGARPSIRLLLLRDDEEEAGVVDEGSADRG